MNNKKIFLKGLINIQSMKITRCMYLLLINVIEYLFLFHIFNNALLLPVENCTESNKI